MHRSYQILHELGQVVGSEEVLLFTKHQFLAKINRNEILNDNHLGPVQKLRQWAVHRTNTAKRLVKNPYRLAHRTEFATGLHPSIKSYYEQQVSNLGPAVCVMEHAEFGELIRINRKHKIATVSCSQNLDALSQNFELLSRNLNAIHADGIDTKQQTGIYAAIVDFANELQVMAQCDERLFISKLEAGLIGGLGLTAQYYPYVPVGAIRERLWSIRQKRAATERSPGLFLMIGTADYGPIRKSCEWLIQQVRDKGLPHGVSIVVAGKGTDTLTKPGEVIPGMEFKGWVEQYELDQLLLEARAVLVPQRFGFGVPTRIAELACAGIPIIGDRHSTYAVDPPKSFHLVNASWESWLEKLIELSQTNGSASQDEYEDWERTQPRPLGEVVSSLLGR